jgi:hypothetical protein
MNLEGKIVSLVYALLLLGCAFFAAFDTFAFAFGIGDGGGHVSLTAGTLLIGTPAGGVGLVIAALGSWIRRPGISLIAPGKRPYRAACGSTLRLGELPCLLDQYKTGNALWLVGLGFGHSATIPRPGGGGTVLRPLPEIVLPP